MFYFKKTHREKINLPGCRWSNYDRKCDNACCTPRACSTTVVASLKRIYVTAGEERIRRRKGRRIFQLYLFIYAKINVKRIFEIEFDIFNDSNFDTSIIEHTFGSKFSRNLKFSHRDVKIRREELRSIAKSRERERVKKVRRKRRSISFFLFPFLYIYRHIYRKANTRREARRVVLEKGKGDSESGTRPMARWPPDTHFTARLNESEKDRPIYDRQIYGTHIWRIVFQPNTCRLL